MKIKIRRYIAILIIISFISYPIHIARAGAWGEDVYSTLLDQFLDQIWENIEGVILGALKSAALNMINNIINQIISGGSSGPKFITCWECELYQNPLEEAETSMKDILSFSFRGQDSSANFDPFGSEGVTEGGYANSLRKQVENLTINQKTPTFTFDNYASDPSQMFDKKNFRALSSLIDPSTTNSLFNSVLTFQPVWQNELTKQQDIASKKALAYQGFKGTEKEGQVITPGSTIKDIKSNVEDLGNKISAAIENPYEFIASIVGSAVTRFAVSTINNGIGNIQRTIQKGNSNVGTNLRSQVNELMKNNGPGNYFNRGY